ncbi:MAG: glycosyltransferase family 2 protein [Chloroflexi bacterium]|nr:glycosyltransferase family 2 protein [Chloroflexota bacterium]
MMPPIPALVITYHPTPEFFARLPLWIGQLDRLLIVDNASAPETRRRLEQASAQFEAGRVHLLFNPQNQGVAFALNQGFRWALDHGYEHLMVLDQDSRPASNLTRQLLHVYETHPRRERLAILAPRIQDDLTGEPAPLLKWSGLLLRKEQPRAEATQDVALAITSGSLNNLSIYKHLGPFREDFFIDYVDTEYCLRAQRQGYQIAAAWNGILHHRLGNQQKRQIGRLTLRPTFHSPVRWYYIHRNRMAMYGMYALRFPQWAIYDFSVGIYAFLKMLMYEDRKRQKIKAAALGIFDGILRRMGPISPHRRAQIEPEELA